MLAECGRRKFVLQRHIAEVPQRARLLEFAPFDVLVTRDETRGTIVGITRGTGLPEIARATLESIAFQVADVLEAMAADSGERLNALRVDGGAAGNDLLLQLQADVLDVPVERPVVAETTALGAAYLAGLAIGYWEGLDDIESNWALDRRFEPSMPADRRRSMLRDWHRAVERSRGWVDPA